MAKKPLKCKGMPCWLDEELNLGAQEAREEEEERRKLESESEFPTADDVRKFAEAQAAARHEHLAGLARRLHASNDPDERKYLLDEMRAV